MNISKIISLACLLCSFVSYTFAQSGGVKGYTRDDQNQILPFVSIYVKNSQKGTASNQEGAYELRLPAGKYQIVFQSMSYETVEREITVGDELQTLDVSLKSQSYNLEGATVTARREEPAYTIIRKAIAKSKLHKLQVDAYDARIYLKGTGRVLGIPALLKKPMEKDGIVEGKSYVNENITDLHFEQPNKYVRKVISMRSSEIDNQGFSPMDYIQASFYDPMVVESVSPIAPSALAYYRYELESSFTDQGYEVNKIKVTPRSKGDNVWEGYIYIIEDKWCIHSLQLKTTRLGIEIEVQQTYAPIQDGVFMPITHQFKIAGKFFGFRFEFHYIASSSNYSIKVNPQLIKEMKLVDEKIERERASRVNKENKERDKKGKQDLETALAEGQELTRKNLKKLIKEVEKKQLEEEKKQLKKGDIPPSQLVKNDSLSIDSLAKKRSKDDLFWLQNRPIPLADYEVKTYSLRDSLVRVDSLKKATEVMDSTLNKPKKTKKFKLWDLVLGGEYKTGKQSTFKIGSVLENMNYNTVEGFASNFQLSYYQSLKKSRSYQVTGLLRYATAREVFTGKGEFEWNSIQNAKYNTGLLRRKIRFDGGRYIEQFNKEYPIPMLLNTAYSLLLKQNFMKLYEREYVRFRWNEDVREGLHLAASLEYANRMGLENKTDYTSFKWKDRNFTSNNPENLFLNETTAFSTHKALTFQAHIHYKPFLQYGMQNGRRYLVSQNSPVLTLDYRKGMVDVDYDFLAAGIQHKATLGIRSTIGYFFGAGAFLNNRKTYFPDYKHFNGNRIFVQFADPVASFRLLDYYKFSTADKYAEGHAYIQLRKFALTQFTYLRMLGIKENLFVNQLFVPRNNYTEVGYTLDGVLKVLRLEAVAAFENGKYLNWGVRVGLTTTFGLKINEED